MNKKQFRAVRSFLAFATVVVMLTSALVVFACHPVVVADCEGASITVQDGGGRTFDLNVYIDGAQVGTLNGVADGQTVSYPWPSGLDVSVEHAVKVEIIGEESGGATFGGEQCKPAQPPVTPDPPTQVTPEPEAPVAPPVSTPDPTPEPKYEDERPYCVILGSESWDLNGVRVVSPTGGELKKRLDLEFSYPGLWEASNLPVRHEGMVYLSNGMYLLKSGQECNLQAQAQPTPEPQVASVSFNTGIPDLSQSAANVVATGTVEIPELELSFQKYNATPVHNWVNPVSGMAAQYGQTIGVHVNDVDYANLDGVKVIEDGQEYTLVYRETADFAPLSGHIFVTCSTSLNQNVIYDIVQQ